MEANISAREAATIKREAELKEREQHIEQREMELKAIRAKLLSTPKKEYDFMEISNLSVPGRNNHAPTINENQRLTNMMDEDDDIPSPFLKRRPTIA
ncbi:hypothetical protein K7432_017193 [Basidiobolus ranarum]|uniref:Uncharacterized protein n=1 Tax=Basidiobolus ranarum TaxID=34480 RepID=A0ABR2VLG6_9FUNG